MRTGHVVWVAIVAIALGACSRHAPPATPTPQVDTMAAARARADSARAAEARRRAEEEARARAAAEALERARTALTAPIHFAFDRSLIGEEDRGVLDCKISLLQANAGVKLRIEGNCDERGSEEYNLALGMRRAEAAKAYMTGYGIAADRLALLSNGEDKPVDPGHNEEAWAQNRRDDFVITAGGETMRPVALR